MPHFLVQITVEDYETWKPVFDGHAAERQAAGCMGGQILRNADDPNHVTCLLEWDSHENMRAFAASGTLRDSRKASGVSGPPSVFFLEEADRPSM